MKNLFGLFLLLLLFSCGETASQDTATETESSTPPVESEEESMGSAEDPNAAPLGPVVELPVPATWVGLFEARTYDEDKDFVYSNKITISIDSLVDDQVYGHSVVAGNNRPFVGTVEEGIGEFKVNAKEPGDDRYDGVFSFIVRSYGEVLAGDWKAYNDKLPVSEREYRLDKRDFAYDPSLKLTHVGWAELYNRHAEYTDEGEFLTNDVLKYNPSEEELTAANVENMYQGDLEIMRNSIYARHGYSFKNRKVRFIFDSYVDWYMPVATDIRGKLTALEQKNINLIKRYEEHAEKYYDTFGR